MSLRSGARRSHGGAQLRVLLSLPRLPTGEWLSVCRRHEHRQGGAADCRHAQAVHAYRRFGKSIHRNFCTVCGTTLLTEFDVDPEHVSIKACSLDDPSWLRPDRHLFTSRTPAWLKLNDGLMQYERDCELGAGRGNRTHTLLPEPDFESGASTSSAMPARSISST